MRQGSMTLLGKIFRKNDVPYLVIEEARGADMMKVRRIDGNRRVMEMATSEIANLLYVRQTA